MSVQVPLEDLESHAADYGPAAFVLAGVIGAAPRVLHAAVRFDQEDLVVMVGRGMAAAIAANPSVCVLWPATLDQSMSLIVDGEAAVHDSALESSALESSALDSSALDSNAAQREVRIRPSGAVLHRPAPS